MKNWSSPSSVATSTASPLAAPPGASPLLAERGDRAGKADGDHAVEQADVDPELERVRRRDAEQVAVLQPPFDLAPLGRRVARAVRREEAVVAEPLGREPVDELGRLPALRERERPEAPLDEHRLQPGGLGERRAPQAELGVVERRVPEHDRPLGSRSGVVGDDRHAVADQRLPSSPGFEIVADASMNCGFEP